MAYSYGWTDGEIENLPYRTLMEYWLSLNAIESEQQLLSIEAACSPIIERGKRKELIQRYKGEIKKSIDRTSGKLATVADLAKAFAGMIKNG